MFSFTGRNVTCITYIATMGVDDNVTKIKTMTDAKKSLLEKRRKKKETVR